MAITPKENMQIDIANEKETQSKAYKNVSGAHQDSWLFKKKNPENNK